MAELPPPRQDPGQVRELADEILARKEYRPPGRSLLERFLDWVGSLFDGSEVSGTARPGGGGSAVLTLVLLAAVVALLVLLVRALRRRGRPPKVVPEPVTIDVEEHRTAAQWAAAAATHEADGRWKEGLRCRFAALVALLVDAEAVPPTPGRTTRELAADLDASRPAAVASFDEAAGLFERAWYGGEPTGPDEARRFGALADEILEPEPVR